VTSAEHARGERAAPASSTVAFTVALSLRPLQAVLPDELARAAGIDITDARRIVSLVHRTSSLPERAPATIRRRALDAVRAIGYVPALEAIERLPSAVDPFVKYAFRLPDGAVIEAVRIPLERQGRFSACVSSQVGCALACGFCATGRMGLGRNLEAWEIVEQVRALRADLPLGGRIHGVLFQGMGEPLANVERVIQAIRVLAEPSAQAIDMRNVTVCTAGLPAGIRALYREVPAVRLGVSIGSADEVVAAAGEHARATGLSPMLAYTLLAGHNDGDEDAAALADLCERFRTRFGVGPRLSLIPFNADPLDGSFVRSERLDAFRATFRARGLGTIVRYSGGGDVGAACGQLARPTRTERTAPTERRGLDLAPPPGRD
jgi:23S rRNA (adenine2503-C2)-methyltransferase